jgi:hypothetical protein
MTFFKIINPFDKDELTVLVGDEDDSADLFALSRYGVEVRLATEDEVQAIEDFEQEQELGEYDAYYTYPEELDCIILHIKDM